MNSVIQGVYKERKDRNVPIRGTATALVWVTKTSSLKLNVFLKHIMILRIDATMF